MAGKLKLLICCGDGADANMMTELNIEKVTKKMGLGIQEIYHCTVSEGKPAAGQYDIVLCSKNFISTFADAEKRGTRIVGLKNVISVRKIEEGLAAAINK